MNYIHPSAYIAPGVILGDNNTIHANVEIRGFKDKPCDIVIGDNNVIHERTRILVAKLRMGDDNMLHNHVGLIAGEIVIGSKCWFGQYTTLDGEGGLIISDRVGMGFHNNVSTHANWKHVPPGCLLVNEAPVIIEYGVWMMGINVMVSPGVTLARQTIVLPGAVVTKDTEPYCVYGGVPAKKLNIQGWELAEEEE